MFTHCLTMSTTLKPRPVYKKQVVRKSKTMTEQSSPPQTLTKVQSHLPDVQLIERNALWEDFKNRLKINNYEWKKVVEELHEVVKASQPFVNKTIDKVKKITNKSWLH